MSGEKITVTNGVLNVPNNPIVPFIEGDGTGPDIWASASKVLDAAVEKAQTGEWLPKETLEVINEYLIAIKGPLTTPVGGGIRSLNVALRQELDLYVCLRPVRWFEGVPSPVKRPQDTNMAIFRENTEDIYAGVEYEQGSEEAKKLINILQNDFGVTKIRFPETSGIGIKTVSQEGTSRLVRAAIEYALKEGKKSVTLVHKGNIMKFTEGGFKKWGYEVAENEYADKVFTWNQYDRIKEEQGVEAANKAQADAEAAGKIIVKDSIADIFLQQILTRPSEFDVVATMNLNGDYISDALAAQVGGIGIAPGANINYVTGHAIFEATHGTAPKYAGLDKVNPSSVILSGVLMLEHLGWDEAAKMIVKSMEDTIASKVVTYDFARLMDGATEVKCSEFGDELIKNMK